MDSTRWFYMTINVIDLPMYLVFQVYQGVIEKWLVYPIPASYRLYFSQSNIDSIILRDAWGRPLRVNWDSTGGWIDVSSLDPGIYILNMREGSQEWVRRVLVQK